MTHGRFGQRPAVAGRPQLAAMRMQNASRQDLLEGIEACEMEDREVEGFIGLDQPVLVSRGSRVHHCGSKAGQLSERPIIDMAHGLPGAAGLDTASQRQHFLRLLGIEPCH